MATYAVGDVHGCYATLTALLGRLPFDEARDRLWMVGDLVNRGPGNAGVLRWAREREARLSERFVAVLGNHDLHLLRRAEGLRPAKPLDTVDDVLAAADREELLEWLLHRPLVHVEEGEDGGERVLVHAGLPPSWSVAQAVRRARKAEARLRDPQTRRLLLAAHGDDKARRRAGKPAETLDALPNLRTLDAAGRRCDFSGAPADAPRGCVPWFAVPRRKSREAEVVFGHWAALGLFQAPGLTALDSGCVWGRSLSAVRLEDGALFQQPTLDAVGADAAAGEGAR